MVELPPVFSYIGGAMIDYPLSGWWVVVLTEMVVKTATFILQEVYDQYWLWALSPHTARFSRELDLLPVVGSEVNIDEYLDLVRVI